MLASLRDSFGLRISIRVFSRRRSTTLGQPSSPRYGTARIERHFGELTDLQT